MAYEMKLKSKKLTVLTISLMKAIVVQPFVDNRNFFQPERDMEKLCISVYVRMSSSAPGVYTPGSDLGSICSLRSLLKVCLAKALID